MRRAHLSVSLRLLATSLVLGLAGCRGDGADKAAVPAPVSHLVTVESFDTVTGNQVAELRLQYVSADQVVLQPYNVATGEPLPSFRQDCRFAPGTTSYPALSTAVGINAVGNTPTGQTLLATLGVPQYWRSCQEFLPERPLVEERWLQTLAGEQLIDAISIVRSPDGRLTQRHGGEFLAELLATTGHDGYEESVRYVRDEHQRVVARIYGAESWPAEGTYTTYDGIVFDLFLFGALSGLMVQADGNRVSPAAGHLLRLEYDADGRLAETRRYDDQGPDGQWLTDDDVISGGIDRYIHEGGRLVRIEKGLDPVTGAPHQTEHWVYVAGALHEKRLLDADGRLWQRWKYELTTGL